MKATRTLALAITLSSLVIVVPAWAQQKPNEIICAVTGAGVQSTRDGVLVDPMSYVGNLIYNGLVTGGVPEFSPDLVESWTTSADGLTWTFILRKGVKFHDGTVLTASDVEAVYKQILDPAAESPALPLYGMMKSAKAIGASTFEVKLKEPYSSLLYLMMRPIKPASFVSSAALAPGTGPFKVAQQSPTEVALEANREYFGGKPRLDRVTFRACADQKKAWVALMQGEVEAVTDLEEEDYEVIKADPRFRTYESLDGFVYSLIFNTRDPLLSQPDLRRAISSAIDRGDIISRALQDAAVPATGPFLPGSFAADPDPSLQAFDLPKARQALAKLGWKDTDGDWTLEKDGKELTLSIIADKGDTMKEAVATRLQWQLMQAGIRTEVEFLTEQELFMKRLFPGRFQAVIMQTNAFGDPDQPLTAFWTSASIGTSNLAQYGNTTLDRMIGQARAAADGTTRRNLYRGIGRLLATEAPAAFLFVKKRYSATSARIAGVDASRSESFYDSSLKDWYITDTSKGGR